MKWNGPIALVVYLVVAIILTAIMYSSYLKTTEAFDRSQELPEGNPVSWVDKTALFLYSPGEIHASHFKSEINCQHCHTPAKTVKSTLCLSCHSEQDFKQNTESEVIADTHLTLKEQQSCFNCHSEHKGLVGEISVELKYEGHKTMIDEKIREDCFSCHQSEGKLAHLNMISESCIDCHKLEEPFHWDNVTFKHTDVEELEIDPSIKSFTKLPVPDKGQCIDCHEENFHINNLKDERDVLPSVEGTFDCRVCHSFDIIN